MWNPIQRATAMVETIALICVRRPLPIAGLARLMRSGCVGWSSPPMLVLALLGVHHAPLHAAANGYVANPEQIQCIGRSRFSGAPVVSGETNGDPTSRAYAATLFDPVQGTPLIVYGPRYRLSAPLLQSFIKRHECQHANGVRDEIAANCAALIQMRAMGLTAEQEGQLARWHVAEGTIDPQYGGSGAAFWERTLGCAGSR